MVPGEVSPPLVPSRRVEVAGEICAGDAREHLLLHCDGPAVYGGVLVRLATAAEGHGGRDLAVMHEGASSTVEDWARGRGLRVRVEWVRRTGAEVSPLQSLRSLEDCSRAPGNRGVVIGWEDDPLALAGAYLAVARGRQLKLLGLACGLDAVLEHVSGAASATVVASPGRLADLGVARLASGMNCMACVPWGLLTGSDLGSASALVARLLLHQPSPVRGGVLFSSGRSVDSCVDGLELVSLPPHPTDEVASRRDRRAPVLFFVGHGRSYCALEGHLCGRADSAAAGDPVCFDGRDCVYPTHRRIPARELAADVVVVDACAAGAFSRRQPVSPAGHNLAVQMLDGGALGVVTAFRNLQAAPMTQAVAWSGLKAGVPLGELVRQLNALGAGGQEHGEFVLLGDPEFSLAPSVPERHVRAQAERGCLVILQATPGVVERVQIGHEAWAGDPFVGVVVPTSVTGRASAAVMSSNTPATTELLVAWGEDCPAGRHVFRLLAPAEVRMDELSLAHAVVRSVQREWHTSRVQSRGEPPRWMEEALSLGETLERLEEQIAHIVGAPVVPEAVFQTTCRARFEALRRVVALHAAVAEDAADRAQGHVLWLNKLFSNGKGIRHLSPEVYPGRCPYCGSEVLARSYRVGAWPGQTRAVLECAECLVIGDIPAASVVPALFVEAALRRGRASRLRLVIPATRPGLQLVHVAVVGDSKGQVAWAPHTEPRVQGRLAQGGAPLEFSVKIEPRVEAPAHPTWVHGIVLLDGLIHAAVRRLEIA